MKIFLLISSCICCITLYAQKKNDAYRLHIHRASSAITVDGVMDEQAWIDADSAANFFMVLPMDTSHAKVTTQVRMTYDATNLYIVAVCYLIKARPLYG